MNYYYITYKNGLLNPVKLEATDEDDAKKRGLAHYLKNSGDVEYVNLKATVMNVIGTVTKID